MRIEDITWNKWRRGQLIGFSGLDGTTDYANGLIARTVSGPDGIEVREPGTCTILFGTDAGAGGSIRFGGDYFAYTGKDGAVIRGAVLDAWHLLIEGPCSVGEVSVAYKDRESSGESAVAHVHKNGRTLLGARAHFQENLVDSCLNKVMAARASWLESKELPKNCSPLRRKTLARALTVMKSQICSPEGVIRHRWSTPDRWPHKDMWLWDSAFHAVGWRHLDPVLARDLIEAVLDCQRADGFIAHRMSPLSVSEFTQPPVLADAAKAVHELNPDLTWLAAVFPRLERYLRWDMAHRDTDGAGLLEWYIEDDPVCRSGESGMDNSPRFDSAKALDAVDFNAFLARECEVLAEFAEVLGLQENKSYWQAQHGRICGLINERLWCQASGFYFDFDPSENRRSSVASSAGFLPLICGAPSQAQAQQLAAQLADPEAFATAFAVPSISRRDAAHYSPDMWRGPVWININWLIIRGLERYGFHADAEKLRTCTIAEIEKHCGNFGTFFEYYDDRGELEPPALLRKGVCNPSNCYRQVIHDYGWTTTLYVDLVLGPGRRSSGDGGAARF
ncbi:flagellar biosynthesis protein FlgM [Verrucomicrobia bacterium LW23]|nr:flagellar biosynthesis protein FlgM [Verrucomicrobia bacterium LW23]